MTDRYGLAVIGSGPAGQRAAIQAANHGWRGCVIFGRAHFNELARGQIPGELHGLLKLLVSTADRTLLGVHIVGKGAAELIHVRQTVMIYGATVDDLVDQVLNYPTLAEAYKAAALGVSNRLQTIAKA